MKTQLRLLVGIAGTLAMTGCGADVNSELLAHESAELTGLARGIHRDYDGDGKADIIFYNSSGSYLYRGQATSGWIPDTWVRTDLVAGSVKYIAGDFNGDSKSDLMITTSSGSYLYAGKTGGGFTADVWTSSAYTMSNSDFVVGDFNGDSKSDLLVVTSSGTSLYNGKSPGYINTSAAWTKSFLTAGNVTFARGDFNGDAKTDLLVTKWDGTFEYLGTSSGLGSDYVYWTTSFTLNSSKFVTADFNGDGKGDFVAQTFDGSFLYTGKSGAAGGFDPNVWTNSSLEITSGDWRVGDFNGDGKWDLLGAFATSLGGTFIRLGQTSGGFGSNVWSDSTLDYYKIAVARDDYTGDGKDDFVVETDATQLPGRGSWESTGKSTSPYVNNAVWTRSDLDRSTNMY